MSLPAIENSFALALKEQNRHAKKNRIRAKLIRKRPISLPDLRSSEPERPYMPNPIGSSSAYNTFLCKALPKAPRKKPMGLDARPSPRILKTTTKGFGDTSKALHSFKNDFAGCEDVDNLGGFGDWLQEKNFLQAAKRKKGCTSSSWNLPEGWKQYKDEQQNTNYYHNQGTGKTQWKAPHKRDPTILKTYKKPFADGKPSLWPSNEPPPRAGKQPLDELGRRQWKKGRKMVAVWLKKLEEYKSVFWWKQNHKEHSVQSEEFTAALHSAKTLATLRIVAFRWRNYTLSNATKQFAQNYNRWKFKFARFEKKSAQDEVAKEIKRMMLLIFQCSKPGETSLTRKRCQEKVAGSDIPALSAFGNWLLAHSAYNWHRFRRGRPDAVETYKQSDFPRALRGWIEDRKTSEVLQRVCRARLTAVKQPVEWWPRLARVLMRDYWTTAHEWWKKLKVRVPGIEDKVVFSGSALANALWVCTQAKEACEALSKCVQHVMFAGHVNKVGVGCFELKQKRKLNKQQTEEANEIFNMYDLDMSGSIEIVELHNGLLGMGFSVTTEQVEALLNAVDEEQTGKIVFEEFVKLLEAMPAIQTNN